MKTSSNTNVEKQNTLYQHRHSNQFILPVHTKAQCNEQTAKDARERKEPMSKPQEQKHYPTGFQATISGTPLGCGRPIQAAGAGAGAGW